MEVISENTEEETVRESIESIEVEKKIEKRVDFMEAVKIENVNLVEVKNVETKIVILQRRLLK